VVPGTATITGDLTVNTSTLKVDSANNRVGIKTATPAAPLHVASGNIRVDDGYQLEFGGSTNSVAGSNATNTVQIYTNNVERYRIDSTGTSVWSVGGSEAMRLNSTGLGVGVTPAVRFDSLVADAAECGRFRAASGWLRIHPYLNATDYCRVQAVNGTNTALIPLTLEGLTVRLNSNFGNAVTIDSLGNTISNVNSAVPTLGANSQMVFNLTSNTNLRISVRGTDGVTRVANITLA
jgi:hypothetical protein